MGVSGFVKLQASRFLVMTSSHSGRVLGGGTASPHNHRTQAMRYASYFVGDGSVDYFGADCPNTRRQSQERVRGDLRCVREGSRTGTESLMTDQGWGVHRL